MKLEENHIIKLQEVPVLVVLPPTARVLLITTNIAIKCC